MGRVEYLPIEWHTRFKGRLYRESGEAAAGVSAAGDDTATGARRGTPSPASASTDDPVTTAEERGSTNSSTANAEIGRVGGRSNAMASSERVGPESVRSAGGAERHTAERGNDGKGGESHFQRDRASVGGGGGGGPESVGSGNGLSIWDITLPRAPTLRAFTNDTLLDILYFMSPEYHQVGYYFFFFVCFSLRTNASNNRLDQQIAEGRNDETVYAGIGRKFVWMGGTDFVVGSDKQTTVLSIVPLLSLKHRREVA